jgi:hypothetical protein
VIRICYSGELQPGLNGHATRIGRTTVIYLLPGLTPDQRAATLRRLRQHGRMGIGPPLPVVPLLLAQAADRVKVVLGRAGAIVRTHPAGSALPLMMVSAAVVGFLLLSAVSIRIIHTPQAVGGAIFGRLPVPAASPGPGQRRHGSQPGAVPETSPGSSPGAGASGQGPRPGGPATMPGSASASGGTTLSSTAAASPPPISPRPVRSPTPSPLASASVSVTASPSAAPSATSSGSSTRVCVGLGPVGVCLKL